MIGRGLTGSAVRYTLALSANDFDAAACSLPIDFSQFQMGTLIVNLGSVNSGFEAVVQRSSTSDGTFAQFGASIGVSTGSQLLVRSFGTNTSNIWHRVYTTNGTGSATAGIVFAAQGARLVPVTQSADVTVHSDVAG